MIDRSQAAAASPSTASRCSGFAGDTLASALLANGQTAGRPQLQVPPPARHPHGRCRRAERAGDHRARRPHASRTPARRCRSSMPALTARSQNRWPSLDFDIGAVNGLLSPFLGAGFYYKTFMWPAALLGKALRAVDPQGRRSRPGELRAPIRTATRNAGRIATCWSSAPARPVLRPR